MISAIIVYSSKFNLSFIFSWYQSRTKILTHRRTLISLKYHNPSVPGKKIVDPGTTKPETSADFSKANLSNPYFTHHSDHPGLVLISKPLNGENYSTWKKGHDSGLQFQKQTRFLSMAQSKPLQKKLIMKVL